MHNPSRNAMNAIKMNRITLLDIVRGNLVKHVAEYNEAVEDYKVLAVKLTKENLAFAKVGTLESIAKVKSLPAAPTSYESNYHRAIRMLELSVEEIIDVEEDVFNQLVLDEWQWKNNFAASNNFYKTSLAGLPGSAR